MLLCQEVLCSRTWEESLINRSTGACTSNTDGNWEPIGDGDLEQGIMMELKNQFVVNSIMLNLGRDRDEHHSTRVIRVIYGLGV